MSDYNVSSMASGGFQAPGLGFNVPTAQLALAGLGTIGDLWAAFQGMNLAKKQFNFQKDFANTNLANQIKSYNTALADRARTRAFTEGTGQTYADSYYNSNKLDQHKVG